MNTIAYNKLSKNIGTSHESTAYYNSIYIFYKLSFSYYHHGNMHFAINLQSTC